MSYQDYLKSKQWADLKTKFRKKIKTRRCQFCGAMGELHIHHRTYVRLGRERFKDLVQLCDPCHSAIHDLVKSGKVKKVEDATRIVGARTRKDGQFQRFDARGKKRQELRAQLKHSRMERFDAFERAIS